MNEETTTQPTQGTWDNLNTEVTERKPKVEFEMKKSVTVVLQGEPKELQGAEGTYYIFDVKEKDEDKVIMTSAWTLLLGLKAVTPLAGKTVEITKDMKDGKQQFEVKLVSDVKEESKGEM